MLMLRQSIFLYGRPGVIDVLATSTSVTAGAVIAAIQMISSAALRACE